MMWWRKLTFEWPVALGDRLWWALVMTPAEFLNALTVKRVFWKAVWFAAIVVLVYGLAQTFPLDTALVFAGDTMIYLEIVTAIMFVAARAHVRVTLDVARHRIRDAAQSLSRNFIRYRLGTRQRRNVNALKRKRTYKGPLSSEDEPVIWSGASYAVA